MTGKEPFSRSWSRSPRYSSQFMDPGGSLLCSHKQSTEPDEVSPHPCTLFYKILFPHIRPCFLNCTPLRVFTTKILWLFLMSLIRDTLPHLQIPFDFVTSIISGEEYKLWRPSLSLVSFFCHFLYLRSSHSPVSCSETPSITVHTHTQQEVKL